MSTTVTLPDGTTIISGERKDVLHRSEEWLHTVIGWTQDVTVMRNGSVVRREQVRAWFANGSIHHIDTVVVTA